MAHGHKASDWTVRHTTGEGTVDCGEYRGRFEVQPDGTIRITWQQGPGPEEDGAVGNAAREAIDAAIRPQSGS
ncbi:hypothetical protein KXS07_13090 [Inquilinus limosus]|uniref:hypothetical protein n=1 Tax=Inquilinus limosus TaxID=171674 RepID=UPI003F13D89E